MPLRPLRRRSDRARPDAERSQQPRHLALAQFARRLLIVRAAIFAPAALFDIEQRRDQVDAGHAFGGRAVEDVANIAEQDDAGILIVIGVREGDGRLARGL